MNLIVTVNSNYIRPLKIMLLSFMEHNPGRHKVYFLYADVTEAELNEVGQLVSVYGSCMIPVRMEEEIFADMPVMQYFTKEMYYRLLAGQMLSKEEKRAIYLDPDILVRGSLETMYEQDMDGMVLAGIEDYAVKTLLSDHKKEIGFGRDEPYINSGVLLMDLNRLRGNFSMKELYRIMEGREAFIYPDQDIINLMFRNKIKILERKYNYNTGYGSAWEMLKYLAGGFAKEKKYPVIVHYMGRAKPWHPDYCGKFGKEYRRYLKKVPADEEENEIGRLLAVAGHLLEVFKRKLGGR